MRTIQIECPCGRLLRVGQQAIGRKGPPTVPWCQKVGGPFRALNVCSH